MLSIIRKGLGLTSSTHFYHHNLHDNNCTKNCIKCYILSYFSTTVCKGLVYHYRPHYKHVTLHVCHINFCV